MGAHEQFESDVIQTSTGDLTITFLGHGSLILAFNGQIIYVDPFSRVADYAKLPKADVILVTHEHGDHLDPRPCRPTTSSTSAITDSPFTPRGSETDTF
jgi:L-ascorbate metabolism protein UlaG (beta-lactamase superfamily)